MSESEIVSACLQWLRLKGIFAWRQNNIPAPTKDGKFRRFVGMKGVSDILGIVSQKCPCTLQGVFLAVEVKRPGQKLRESQTEFLQKVNELGGIGICVHSVDELETEMAKFLL